MFGTLPVFQINQLVQVTRDVVAIPAGITSADDHFTFDLLSGIVLSGLVFAVIVGRIQRIATVTSRIVPFMVAFYLLMTAVLLFKNAPEIPGALALIVSDWCVQRQCGGWRRHWYGHHDRSTTGCVLQ
ncbi:MAG: alanine:cation symporter family protein [Woeseiaceae bacterium]|nr:alanine:cation symporter family protein [Woeseiaceae bacterium]